MCVWVCVRCEGRIEEGLWVVMGRRGEARRGEVSECGSGRGAAWEGSGCTVNGL